MFTDRYQKQHPEADIIKLDAVIIETERKFDCVYSNKVLHHLTREELRRSLFNQRKVLNPKALLLHTFWYGNKSVEHNGLLFSYYTEENLKKMVEGAYEIIKMERYKEMAEQDSIYLLMRKK